MEPEEINKLLEPETSEANLMDYFPFMELPKEIRGLIYNLIPQAHVVECRLVCSQWQTEIDDLYSFHGVINEDKPFWERIFGLRLANCTLQNLVVDSSPYLFKYPHAMKYLTINLYDGKCIKRPLNRLLAANVAHVLTQIAKHLNVLCIRHLFMDNFTPEFGHSLSVANFANLQSLSVHLSYLGGLTWEPFNAFVSNATINRLKAVQITISQSYLNSAGTRPMTSKLLCSLFVLLAQNTRLDDLYLFVSGTKPDEGDEAIEIEIHDSDLMLVDWNSLSKVDQLKNYRLTIYEVRANVRLGSNFTHGWGNLLQLQRRLVKYDITAPSPWPICKKIISANFESLVKIRLDPLLFQTNDGQPGEMLFDMTIFQRCTSLKDLYLGYNSTSTTQAQVQHLQVRVDNMCRLPASLEKLMMRNFNILADQLIQFISSSSGRDNFKKFTVTGERNRVDELYQSCKSQHSGFESWTDKENALMDCCWSA